MPLTEKTAPKFDDDGQPRTVSGWFEPNFTQPLYDLGRCEAATFSGVLSPAGEIGAVRLGVNSVFLENAEDYYKKYQGFDYWRKMLSAALEQSNVRKAGLIVEYGCGFGNATLPMLDLLPTSQIIATDISPNLLSILRRLLASRSLEERCVPVAMDAQKPYIKEGVADLVFGAAILHHLLDPMTFVQHAMKVLKPGGVAFFFEPLEGGYATLVAICDEVSAEAKRRNFWDHSIYVTEMAAADLRPQILRAAMPGWHERDDKWVFPRSLLDDMAAAANSTVTLFGLHDNIGQFRRHFSYMLKTYYLVEPSDYPAWAWEIFDRYDRHMYSRDMLRDLAIEGCIIFRKNGGQSAPR